MPVGTQLVMDHVIQAGDHNLLVIICVGLLFYLVPHLRFDVSLMDLHRDGRADRYTVEIRVV